MQTAEPQPVALMNTIRADRTGRHDRLDRDDLRELRDALRRLAAEVTGDRREAAASAIQDLQVAVDVVNRACAKAPSWSQLTWPATRTTATAHTQEEALVSTIAEEAVQLFTGPDRDNLRACEGPGCVLYFVRNHPRRGWCSSECGNRARVARHYRRHHPDKSSKA
ncbi:MAG: ABATE domain-containing protein [Kibdelosporangium sp.]